MKFHSLQELQNIINSSVDGVVLFSLGNVKSQQIGEYGVSDMLDVFRQFPTYTFLWKIDSEKFTMPIPENVLVKESFPLTSILGNFLFDHSIEVLEINIYYQPIIRPNCLLTWAI